MHQESFSSVAEIVEIPLVDIVIDRGDFLSYIIGICQKQKERGMPRPCKCRRVCGNPKADYFKPRGISIDALEEVGLTIDEFEAIRLADLEGLYQEDAAKKMNISRQTFGNIIESAHRKIADTIVNAKALKIEGGVIIRDRGGMRGRGLCAGRQTSEETIGRRDG